MWAIANKIKALLGLAVSRTPIPPPISQLSFRIQSADTSTPLVDSSKKIDFNPTVSIDRKIRKATQRAKRNFDRAQLMSSAASPHIQPSKWTTSQLLQLFDHGSNCQKDSDWSGVVEGKSANASKQTWGYVVCLPSGMR